MIEYFQTMMSEHGLTLAQSLAMPTIYVIFEYPVIGLMLWFYACGKFGQAAFTIAFNLIRILPVTRKGLARYKQFIITASYIAAVALINVKVHKLTPALKARTLAYSVLHLLRTKNLNDSVKQMHKFASNNPDFGLYVCNRGVMIKVAWVPNFEWSAEVNRLKA